MKKVIAGLVCIASLWCLTSCSSDIEKKKSEAQEKGYASGYAAGMQEAKKDGESALRQLASDHKNKLIQRTNEYERKRQNSYNAAFSDGKKSMRRDLDNAIDLNSTEKKSQTQKKDWDAQVSN